MRISDYQWHYEVFRTVNGAGIITNIGRTVIGGCQAGREDQLEIIITEDTGKNVDVYA